MLTVKMSIDALRRFLGKDFDMCEFDHGRQDAREFAFLHPHEVEEKVQEVQNILASADFRHMPGPSYWLGCLAVFELDI